MPVNTQKQSLGTMAIHWGKTPMALEKNETKRKASLFFGCAPSPWVQKTELRQHQRGWVKSWNNEYALPASAGYLVSVNLMHCKWAAVRTVITVNRTHLESSSKYEQGRKMSWKKSITLWKLWKLQMAVISTVNCIWLRSCNVNESISRSQVCLDGK